MEQLLHIHECFVKFWEFMSVCVYVCVANAKGAQISCKVWVNVCVTVCVCG